MHMEERKVAKLPVDLVAMPPNEREIDGHWSRRLHNMEIVVAAIATQHGHFNFEVDTNARGWLEEVCARAIGRGLVGESRPATPTHYDAAYRSFHKGTGA
jgi:hypothetical protein